MPIFAVHYTYTDATAAARLENRPAHRAFLNNLVDQGTILTSGPYTDGTGALILFRAENIEVVEKLLPEDPFATLGLIEAKRVVEWLPVMGTFSEE
ncbi:YciI family protein [Nocardia yamanashiensis]|uniref:YciI family protein n=1 Tax=Nocardia yamanashiensis TaxID=209247 RepID=UPI001E40F7F0|nr:YciI family protein [Nocardia yamanashiensis]UGT42365.1 YciI family protein [Nocardia yamanashiensis]